MITPEKVRDAFRLGRKKSLGEGDSILLSSHSCNNEEKSQLFDCVTSQSWGNGTMTTSSHFRDAKGWASTPNHSWLRLELHIRDGGRSPQATHATAPSAWPAFSSPHANMPTWG